MLSELLAWPRRQRTRPPVNPDDGNGPRSAPLPVGILSSLEPPPSPQVVTPPTQNQNRIKSYASDAMDLTRIVGFLVAHASEDWTLLLDLCETVAANEENAKTVAIALRREFKYGEPAAQLSAARLWAILLRNTSEYFVAQSMSRKFLRTIEDVLSSSRTAPVVRERLLFVLGAAAYASPPRDTQGFRGLWLKVRPLDQPEEGVPLDIDDPIFNPPPLHIGDTPSVAQLQRFPLTPLPGHDSAQKSDRPGSPVDALRPIVEEDFHRLHAECRIGRQHAVHLSQALESAQPTTVGKDYIQELYLKSRFSYDLLEAQIPWAKAGAKKSRALLSGDELQPIQSPTQEESLLQSILQAYTELKEALFKYDTNILQRDAVLQHERQPGTGQTDAHVSAFKGPSPPYASEIQTPPNDPTVYADPPSIQQPSIIRPSQIMRPLPRTPGEARPEVAIGAPFISSQPAQGPFQRTGATSVMHPPSKLSIADLTAHIIRTDAYAIAHGGFADVWKCVFQDSTRVRAEVAVKVLRCPNDDELEKAKLNKRLRKELNVWAQLHHPNVLPLLGTATGFGHFVSMVCPWKSNGTLNKYLTTDGAELSSSDRFIILRQICAGLTYLHSRSVVHGDLTSSNILIDNQGSACLSDFGLSTIRHDLQLAVSVTSSIGGNVRFAAPECFRLSSERSAQVTRFGDIYSFGSVMLQTLTGRIPYHYIKQDPGVLLELAKGGRPDRPADALMISDSHWNFVNLCWASDPPRRPSLEAIDVYCMSQINFL